MTAATALPEGVPAHADGTLLVASPDGAQLYDAAGGRGLRLDDLALALWELCDGETSVAEMVDAICDLFDAPAGVVHDDVTATLRTLGAAGLLVWLPHPAHAP